MAETTVKVVFVGDAKNLRGEIDNVDQSTKKLDDGFKKVGAAMAGAFAVGAVASFAGDAFAAAEESAKIAAQTEAVIKSTGQAAGLTAGEIDKMAGALSKKNTVDDEAIQSGQNLLLTFTNIGKADGIFERTTQASIDMAAAMGTDVTSAAMQLGKALNDPSDGLSKLSRAGIQFTDEQKDQIKAMQASGDMAGAQAVMLGELERQFGGSAAAQATSADKMRLAWGNFQEQIGAKLIPAVNGLFVAFEKIARFVSENREVFIAFGIGIAVALVPAFIGWATAAGAAAIATVVAAAPVIALGAVVAGLAAGIIWAYQNVDFFRAAVDAVASFLTGTVVPAFQGLWDKITDVFGWLRDNWPTVLAILTGPFGLAVLAITKNWDTIKEGVSGVKDWIVERFDEIVGFVTGMPGKIRDAALGMWDGVTDAFKGAINSIIRAWNDFELGFSWGGKDMPGPIPDIPGFDIKIGTPNIPYLAKGGITTGPTMAVLGDNPSGREAVIPLDSPTGRRMLGGTFNVTINMPPGSNGDDVVAAIQSFERRNGAGWRHN